MSNTLYLKPYKQVNDKLLTVEIKEFLLTIISEYKFLFKAIETKKDSLQAIKFVCKDLNIKLFFYKKMYGSGTFSKEFNKLDIKVTHCKEYVLATFFHELGHWIQWCVIKNYDDKINKTLYLSEEIRFEQQAQAIAFFLYKKMFDRKIQNNSKFFLHYFRNKDYKWLYNYYNKKKYKIINDLI